MTTADKIRAARKNARLTQKQLGELCGIAEPTIRKYELGKLHPKIETIKKIAAPLGVYYLDLYGEDETDLLKEGVKVGTQVKKSSGNILTRMEIVSEFQEQGYTFDPEERRLVCAFNKLNDLGRVQILYLSEGMAEIPRFMLEPPELPQEAPTPPDSETTPEDG